MSFCIMCGHQCSVRNLYWVGDFSSRRYDCICKDCGVEFKAVVSPAKVIKQKKKRKINVLG